MGSNARHLRARYAAIVRQRGRDDPEAVRVRAELHADVLGQAIAETVAASPPFTDDQRRRLVALLGGSAAAPEAAPEAIEAATA